MNFDKLLNKNLIKELNFETFLNNFNLSLSDDFHKSPGIQHYKLLAYLSSLFNDVTIIEIGTHVGESAVALAYNKNNIIYTFDIIDKIFLFIFKRK